MPVVVGRSPVSTLEREGLHSGAWQCALVKSVPRRPRRSMFGVTACGWPPRQPTQSFRSSTAMNRTFGRCSPAIVDVAAEAQAAAIRESAENHRIASRSPPPKCGDGAAPTRAGIAALAAPRDSPSIHDRRADPILHRKQLLAHSVVLA